MPAMTPADPDGPLMKAWEAFKQTDEFANSHRWARTMTLTFSPDGEKILCEQPHLIGSLWAIFSAGFQAGQSINKVE